MKKISVPTVIVFMSLIFLFGFIKTNEPTSGRTEEYAIVDVLDSGKKKWIRITIGEKPAIEKEWKKEKTAVRGDLSPVIRELNKLNEQGFKLFSASTAYLTRGNSGSISGYPHHTFVMKKIIHQ